MLLDVALETKAYVQPALLRLYVAVKMITGPLYVSYSLFYSSILAVSFLTTLDQFRTHSYYCLPDNDDGREQPALQTNFRLGLAPCFAAQLKSEGGP